VDIGDVVGVIGDKFTHPRSLKHHQAAVPATRSAAKTSHNFLSPFDVFNNVVMPFAAVRKKEERPIDT
jgi:hypothetical protein